MQIFLISTDDEVNLNVYKLIEIFQKMKGMFSQIPYLRFNKK